MKSVWVVVVGVFVSLVASAGCFDGVEVPGTTSCVEETVQCPDGSSVTRQLPLCTLAACPAETCDQLATFAEAKLAAALVTTCESDADCVSVPFTADCFDACTRSGNKASLPQVDAARQQVNGNQCKQFTAQKCTFVHPPCAAVAPHCAGKVCQ